MKDDLEKFYQQHRQGLFSMAVAMTGCVQQAEDAIHAAFETLCRHPQLDPGTLKPYVFAMVRNSAIDLHRKQKRHNRIAETLFDNRVHRQTSAQPDDSLLTAERDQLLRMAIEALADDDREIVVLKAFGHLTFDEIAEVVDRPMATVATRYRRALSILEQKLKADL